ncbi:hypothetical protein LTR37_011748 [Vermiconidia calcicola]|uniref:Uncharacterized protein n=1 Tax=Vermiconidia calcicola TaxID=1690605 RepID=A0ACC3N2W7_9PEZI|nr:hypothetical protein LTR37_011748 [Vermiconidia calcicola]
MSFLMDPRLTELQYHEAPNDYLLQPQSLPFAVLAQHSSMSETFPPRQVESGDRSNFASLPNSQAGISSFSPPCFSIRPHFDDLATLEKALSCGTSVISNNNPDEAGTRCIGPIYLQRRPGAVSQPTRVSCYKFQFLIDGSGTLTTFRYSTRDNLLEKINDFVLKHGLGEDLIMPIRLVVEAALGTPAEAGWNMCLGDFCDHHPHNEGTTQPCSSRQQSSSGGPDWAYHQASDEVGSIYQAEYRSHTDNVQVSFGRKLRYTEDDDEETQILAELSSEWRQFAVKQFMQLSFTSVLPQLGESIFAKVAASIASATLASVAQSFHVGGTDCQCEVEDALYHEGFQMDLRKGLMTVLPAIGHRTPKMYELRARYTFELLNRAMTAMKMPVEALLPYMLQDDRSIKAAACIQSSLDKMSGNHAEFVGAWCWEGILCKLCPPAPPSINTAFIGRPGNPGQSRTNSTEMTIVIEDDGSRNGEVRQPNSQGSLTDCRTDGTTKTNRPSRRKQAKAVNYDTKRHPQDDDIPGCESDRLAEVRRNKKRRVDQATAEDHCNTDLPQREQRLIDVESAIEEGTAGTVLASNSNLD